MIDHQWKMDEQTKNNNENKNKKQGKCANQSNKNAKKIFKMFHGPQVDCNFLDKNQAQIIVNEIIKTIKSNQYSNPKPDQDNNEIKNKSKAKLTANKLSSHEIIFGLNSVIRKIQSKHVIGVIINGLAARDMRNIIVQLCLKNDIPCICLTDFNQLCKHFNISRITVMAMTPKVAQANSIFYQFYQTFKSIACKEEEKSHVNLTSQVQHDQKSDGQHAQEVPAQTPSYDILYTKIEDDDYNELVNRRLHEMDVTEEHEQSKEIVITFNVKSKFNEINLLKS